MTVCVHTAGRGERHATDRVSFTWLVYQGAPDGAVGGVVDLDDTWLTGSTCKRVDLAITFDSPPIVLATLRHSVPGVRRDAATLWAEDVGTSSFSLCARELQNFDGAHKNVSIVRHNKSARVYFFWIILCVCRLGWLYRWKGLTFLERCFPI